MRGFAHTYTHTDAMCVMFVCMYVHVYVCMHVMCICVCVLFLIYITHSAPPPPGGAHFVVAASVRAICVPAVDEVVSALKSAREPEQAAGLAGASGLLQVGSAALSPAQVCTALPLRCVFQPCPPNSDRCSWPTLQTAVLQGDWNAYTRECIQFLQ